MRQDQRLTRTVLQTIAQSDARSPLFWWMLGHHDEIIAAAAGERIRWAAFCAEAARLNLTDTRGRPPTERNARETWRRQARRVVARAKLRQAATVPSPKLSSLIAPDRQRQAPLVPPPPTHPTAPPAMLARPQCRRAVTSWGATIADRRRKPKPRSTGCSPSLPPWIAGSFHLAPDHMEHCRLAYAASACASIIARRYQPGRYGSHQASAFAIRGCLITHWRKPSQAGEVKK